MFILSIFLDGVAFLSVLFGVEIFLEGVFLSILGVLTLGVPTFNFPV